MGIFSSISEGWKLFKDSLKVIGKYPILLAPIFLAWIIVAALVLYVVYLFEFPEPVSLIILSVYLILVIITFATSLSNIIMLEFVQQIESGRKISVLKALKETFIDDFWKVIPIALIWAFVWLIILVIKVLTSKKRGGGKKQLTAENAAKTLGGAKAGPFSWLSLGLDAFEKFIRMFMFLSLPAIAWEDKGPMTAFGRAGEIIRRHPGQFFTTYTLTALAAFVMAVPLAIVFYINSTGVSFSTAFWICVILYEGMAWTFSNYLEQMSVGLLYLWHMKWVKKGAKGELSSVRKPDLLDKYYELKS